MSLRLDSKPTPFLLLFPAQSQFLDSPATFRAFVGGRGAGKSFVGAYDLLKRARRGGLYMVAAPTYPMLRDASLRSFLDVARRIGTPILFRRSDMAAVLPNGAEVLFRSADDPDRLRGPNLSGAWLDEASVMAVEAYEVVLAALRQDGRQGWMSATFTPRGLAHWTYEKFGRPDAPPDTEIIHSRTDENPFLPAEFAATVAGQYDDQLAARELGGEFVDLEGAEWPVHYFRSEVWFDHWLPHSEYPLTVIALDPSRGRDSKAGDYAAFVICRLDKQNIIWCDAVLVREDVPRLVARGVELVRGYPGASMVVETNIGQELLIGEFKRTQLKAGVMFGISGYENRVPKVVRIRRLGPYLAHGRARFRATPGGKLLAAQLQQFPNGAHDDAPDAMELSVRRLEELVSGVKK